MEIEFFRIDFAVICTSTSLRGRSFLLGGHTVSWSDIALTVKGSDGMSAKVVFHVSSKSVESYQQKPHLDLFGRIHELIEARGGQVVATARDKRLRNPSLIGWDGVLDDGNLHIVENGWVNQPNVLNATIAYVRPYWHLDAQGVLCNSSISGRTYSPKRVPYKKAKAFFQSLRDKHVETRRSRYGQKREFEELPKGAIAVFLQGDLPHRQRTAYCSTEEMLRAVVSGAGGRTVVVKAHPESDPIPAMETVHRLLEEGYDILPTDANIHDILATCCATVSFGSAVCLEGFMHRRPAIMFGQCDFHHYVETVHDVARFPEALERALARKGGYAQYLYWYFNENCLSLDAPDFDQQILQRFSSIGFDAQRLGIDVPSAVPAPTKMTSLAQTVSDLEDKVRSHDGVDSFVISERIKTSKGSDVYDAILNAERVVLKIFHVSDPVTRVTAMKQELDFVSQNMARGAYQVNQCKMCMPEIGAIAVSHVGLQRLDKLIWRASGAERAHLLHQSGAWLSAYIGGRHRTGPSRALKMMRKLEGKNLSAFTKEDRALIDIAMDQLWGDATGLKGRDVLVAATHGDFVGMNIHVKDKIFYGVDIQGTSWLPVAKDVARFLVWLRMHEPKAPVDPTFGLCTSDIDAICASGLLDPDDANDRAVLRFFIGENLCSRFIEEYARPDLRWAIRRALKDYLGSSSDNSR